VPRVPAVAKSSVEELTSLMSQAVRHGEDSNSNGSIYVNLRAIIATPLA
jgi:hypothetical protein